MTTIKLFDETVLIAEVKEENETLNLTFQLEGPSGYSAVFQALNDSNLSAITVTYDDGTFGNYSNLKFLAANAIRKTGLYYVVVQLTTKSAYEIAVDGLSKEVNQNDIELTKTQLALVEIYESLLVV